MQHTFIMTACAVLLNAVDVTAQSATLPAQNLQHAEHLKNAGIEVTRTVTVDGVEFGLSSPIALDRSHQIAVAWVSRGDLRSIRVLYRSNSQCSWRLCDAVTPNHIGKGFHERDKQMPLDVSMALLEAHQDVIELRPWRDSQQELTSHQLAQQLLALLTEDRDAGIPTGRVVDFGGHYVTREYASIMPIMPTPLTIVKGYLKTPTGGKLPDPQATQLPSDEHLPDFTQPLAEVRFRIPAYAQFSDTDGSLIGRMFPSHDGRLKYFFVEDQHERTMLSGVEILTAPVSILGLRTQYPDLDGMDTPLMEYTSQIPEEFGGTRKLRYALNWRYVRELPIIQHYYTGQGRERPSEDRSPVKQGEQSR